MFSLYNYGHVFMAQIRKQAVHMKVHTNEQVMHDDDDMHDDDAMHDHIHIFGYKTRNQAIV